MVPEEYIGILLLKLDVSACGGGEQANCYMQE